MADTSLRLLLIEDNPGDARLLEAMLEDEEDEVALEWVQSLDDGVQKLTHGDYDAVLLDLSLPDSHGIESVATTHLFDTVTPIIVLTGLDDDESAFQALREGAQEYLVKGTITGRSLLRTIRFARERVGVQEKLERQREALPVSDLQDSTVRPLVCPPGEAMLPLLRDYFLEANEGNGIVYVAFDKPASVMDRKFAQSGTKTQGMHFIDASGQSQPGDGRIHVVEDARDLSQIAVEIELACGALGPDAHVVVDNINSLILLHGVDTAAVFCHTLANRLRLLQISADFIGHNNQEWPFLADRLSFLDAERVLHEAVAEPRSNDPSFA